MLISDYELCLLQMQLASATHSSAAFMDIMKLRLLYLAEVRLLLIASDCF